MLDMLLPEGTIATATYRDGSTEVLGTSDANCIDKPMVVLTNENTASAAELFTQALRDYGVAKSVGTTTYGKGVMQVTHSLKDGSAIRITVAQYNPPKSANYDGVGIKPDYEVTLTEDQVKAFDTLDETTDPQLKKALEITNSSTLLTQNTETTTTEESAAPPRKLLQKQKLKKEQKPKQKQLKQNLLLNKKSKRGTDFSVPLF